MTRALLLLLTITGLLMATSDARIGETYEQVVQRYGREIRVMDRERLAFRYNDFLIVVSFREQTRDKLFRERVSECEAYHHDDEGKPLSKSESAALLSANAPGHEWVDGAADSWTTDDKHLFAKLTDLDRLLLVATQDFRSRMKAQKNERMSGF